MISIHEIEKKSEEIKKLEELYAKSIQSIKETSSQTDISNIKKFIEELYKSTENDFIFIKNIYQQMYEEEEIEAIEPIKYKLIDEILQDALHHIQILLNFLKTVITSYTPFIDIESSFIERIKLLEDAVKTLTYGSINPLNITEEEIEKAHKDIKEGNIKTLREIMESIDVDGETEKSNS